MKGILILVIFATAACTNLADHQATGIPFDSVSYKDNSFDAETVEKLRISEKDQVHIGDDREYVDSANFRILRIWYPSGARYLEIYEDKLTKLDYCKEYYRSGQLKEVGAKTNVHCTYVGTWKYYSTTGTVDSIVDYDKKYRISYFEALAIAEKHGFKMPDMELSLTKNKTGTFWLAARWTTNDDGNPMTAEAIQINTGTGKVKKPDGILTAIF